MAKTVQRLGFDKHMLSWENVFYNTVRKRYFSRRRRYIGRKILSVMTPAEENVLLSDKRIISPLITPQDRVAKEFAARKKFIKLEANDSRFGPVVSRAKLKHERYKAKEILLEGHRLIRDALSASVEIKSLFITDSQDLGFFPEVTAPIYLVSKSHMKLWSDVTTPSGTMAIFKMPGNGEMSGSSDDVIPMTIVCDNIRDPGNLGTIIRLAAASQCDRLLLSKGCVDAWDPKVLRSAMGSHFRVRLYCNLNWGIIDDYVGDDSNVLLADAGRTEKKWPERGVAATTPLHSEDAMAIMRGSPDDETGDEENDEDSEDESDDDDAREDESYRDAGKLRAYDEIPLNASPYYDVTFGERHNTLLICNEAFGPSTEAKKLAFDKYGQTVFIPTNPAVESLNSAMAASVIVFEARRQLLTSDKVVIEES